jgi:hypothetical protein
MPARWLHRLEQMTRLPYLYQERLLEGRKSGQVNSRVWFNSSALRAHLGEVASGGCRVEDGQLEALVWADDENCASRQRNASLVLLIWVQHSIPAPRITMSSPSHSPQISDHLIACML